VDTYLLLLRGINVGGRNRLPMADLSVLVSDLGHGDVRTHLQSGNVVCTGKGRPDVVAAAVSAAIRDQLSLTVPVVARSAKEWATIVDHNPFVGDEDDPKRLHVTFLAAPPEPDRVASLEAQTAEFVPDRFSVVGPDVYLHIPDSYADTPLQNGVLEKRLGQVCTTRNWRTVTALADLAGLS
jgi:uncharacterized protein (DUF1697 family)